MGQAVLVVGTFERDDSSYRLVPGGKLNLLTVRTEAELDTCWTRLIALYRTAGVCLFGLGLTALARSNIFFSAFVVAWPAILVAYLGKNVGSRSIAVIRC